MHTLNRLLKPLETTSECLVTWISHHFTLIKVDPTNASEIRCPECGGSQGLTSFLDPTIDDTRVWFCTSGCKSKIPPHPMKKALPKDVTIVNSKAWDDFREANDIGDIYATSRIETLRQPDGVIESLKQFATSPSGVLTLTGKPGTGKTYASMAVAEFATRSQMKVKFYTAIDLASKWSSRMELGAQAILDELKKSKLLIIDDLGQSSAKPGFAELMFEVLSYRLQWSDKGTLFTTNLESGTMLKILGEGIADRMKSAKWIKTAGESRRK